MVEKKRNNWIIVVLLIIIIILGVLCYLFAMDKINLNKDVVNDSSEESYSIKLDINKEYVYDADYNLPTDKESYYARVDHDVLVNANELIVPYININTDDAKKVNQEIYKLYETLIETFNNNLDNEISYTLVKYEVYTNNNILSVIITRTLAGTDVPQYEYYTYNFNLVTGKLLSYNELYSSVGFTDNNIDESVINIIKSTLDEEFKKGLSADGVDEDNLNKSIDNYTSSVNDNNLKYFLDSNNKLNIVVDLSIPAGGSRHTTILVIE